MKKKGGVLVAALFLFACGGGGEDGPPGPPPFPQLLLNFGGMPGASGEYWQPACNQDVRIALRSDGACWQRCFFGVVECTWSVNGVNRIVITGPNNAGCIFSISEVRNGPSEDVFFGRPAFGINVQPECEFRRVDGAV